LEVPGKIELSLAFARLMIFYIFLVSTYAFLMGMAQAHGRFFLSALAPALFNLTLILAALFSDSSGQLLPWGVLVGGILQAGIVAWQLYRLGHLPKWTLQI